MRRYRPWIMPLMGIFATLAILAHFKKEYPHSTTGMNLKKYNYIKGEESPEESDNEGPAVNRKQLREARATRWISDIAFNRNLASPDVSCNTTFRAGKKTDGGWHICLLEPFLLKEPCLVYSFGINYDFSFDDAIAKNFKCTVKSFDPSMKNAKPHKRGKHIEFFKDGISGMDFIDRHGWNLYSLATILKNQNDNDAIIDYFKMDVETSEWEAIPDMAVKGSLNNIKQIGIEIHRAHGDTKSVHLINILEDYGFRNWKTDFNKACIYKMEDGNNSSGCMELYYINTRFIDRGQRKYFQPTKINNIS